MKTPTGSALPFRRPPEIEKIADSLRAELGVKTIPVDIEHILEIQMGIRLIPVPGFRYNYDVEAFISTNWKEIHVDKEAYDSDGYRGRLNFTLAHELGHLILHKDAFEAIGITTIQDFYSLQEAKDEPGNWFHRRAEVQADIFASKFLIPSDKLSESRTRVIKENEKELIAAKIDLKDSEILDPYLASVLAEEFQVSEGAMLVALNHKALDDLEVEKSRQ